MDNDEFRKMAMDHLRPAVYDALNEPGGDTA
jgi:hypothetical protein